MWPGAKDFPVQAPVESLPCASGCDFRALGLGSTPKEDLVAEWIHFTLFGIILPTTKQKVYTFWGL